MGQLSTDLPDRPEPLQASQGCSGDTRDDHQADGGPKPHPSAHLDQDEQLQERNPDKEQEKAAKYETWR